MLNLAQVKSPVNLIPNPNNPTSASLAYRQLKQAGWSCNDPTDREGLEIHPTDRVPVFRLGSAALRRNKSARSHWLLEIGGTAQETSASVVDITAEVEQATSVDPKPISAAQEIALDLKTEYPGLAGNVDRALALVEAGSTEFPQYKTAFDPATFYGCYSCDCPDNTHRQPRAKFGAACKHALAMEISRRVEVNRRATSYRALVDDLERERSRAGALQ